MFIIDDLYSDLLCPNPMTGSGDRDRISKHNSSSSSQLVPVDIWALKSGVELSILPCGLQPPVIPRGGGKLENKILFLNISSSPMQFTQGKLCNKFIKVRD